MSSVPSPRDRELLGGGLGYALNHAAHLWGAVSGLVLTLIFDPAAFKSFLQALHLL